MSTEERDQRRARLEQLSDLDLTLMAEDYLVSLEDHAAAKDWQSAETLKPDLELIDEILKERGLYDARTVVMDVDEKVKREVKAYMRAQGVTQNQLAEKLGIKQPSVAAVLGKTAAVNQGFAEVLDVLNLELIVVPKGTDLSGCL